jgi:hypothetical protein
MIDHTIERTIWRCKMNDDEKTFLEGDEFANRGIIHPCRTPWDTACIEPNGDVRALDFFGPILGNVTSSPISAAVSYTYTAPDPVNVLDPQEGPQSPFADDQTVVYRDGSEVRYTARKGVLSAQQALAA